MYCVYVRTAQTSQTMKLPWSFASGRPSQSRRSSEHRLYNALHLLLPASHNSVSHIVSIIRSHAKRQKQVPPYSVLTLGSVTRGHTLTRDILAAYQRGTVAFPYPLQSPVSNRSMKAGHFSLQGYHHLATRSPFGSLLRVLQNTGPSAICMRRQPSNAGG
jgi:hypothetical protein